jgi:hypothetical protein
METTTTQTLLSFAVAGIMLGAIAGCASSQPAAESPEPAAHAAEAKACCKGMNECKGKGGCRAGEHSCAGQNACKGQGGCNGHCPK